MERIRLGGRFGCAEACAVAEAALGSSAGRVIEMGVSGTVGGVFIVSEGGKDGSDGRKPTVWNKKQVFRGFFILVKAIY